MLCLPNMLPPSLREKTYGEILKMFLYAGHWSGNISNYDTLTLIIYYLRTY